MANPNVILVKGDAIRTEAKASAAITPGHLVVETATVAVNGSAADVDSPWLFADVDALAGNGIDDAYSANDNVPLLSPAPGAEIYAILTTSQTIAKGDALESAGDGTLQARSTGRVGLFAAEAVTTTAAVARIRVTVR